MTLKQRTDLHYGRQSIDEGDIAAVTECLRSDLITQGPRVADFESALCELSGARNAIAVANGTAALHLTMEALKLTPQDIGIAPAITFIASANSIAYTGANVRFADVDPNTALIDLAKLDRQMSSLASAGRPPRVIVAVDMCGQAADLPGLRHIADKYGAYLVEDAAHAIGAGYRHHGEAFRTGACRHTDAAIFSFHPVKHITCGEGGAVLVNDDDIAGRVRELRSHGIHRDTERLTVSDEGPWYYEQEDLGFNYRLTDFQCALGAAQLRKLDGFIARRRSIASRYDDAIRSCPIAGQLTALARLPHCEHAYHLYVVRVRRRPDESVREVAGRRKRLYEHLQRRGIRTQVHYIPLNRQPYYIRHHDAVPEACPGAAEYYASCLSLPIYPSLQDADVDRVVDALRDWCRKQETTTRADESGRTHFSAA